MMAAGASGMLGAAQPATTALVNDVISRESVVEFRDGRDVFRLPWGQKAAFRCTNGVFQAEGRQSALHVAYAAYPGAKPFRGPRVVRLVSEGSVGGSATLYLKNRDSGKEEKRTAKWSDATEFEFNLPSDGWWQFERLSFVFGRTMRLRRSTRT